MLEFLNMIFSPKTYFKERNEARLKRHAFAMKTSLILYYADRADELKDDAAKILFVELAKRVKASGIPLDDWL